MTVEEYFAVYGDYHQNKTNKLIHFLFIPVIVYAILNLLYQLPKIAMAGLTLDCAMLLYIVVGLFYLSLNLRLALAMGVLALPIYWLARVTPWPIGLAAFIAGWIFQFLGHHLEGKKPAFLTNFLHLFIGPLWITGHFMEKLGLWTPRTNPIVQ
ncbi:MAG TPA: Mpo1-like protein [Gemmataceae bacterium]|jgi:uncharacterized membrane protein YGL010W|nr:Mpo1-like protein [Gemmataceae bacterium]